MQLEHKSAFDILGDTMADAPDAAIDHAAAIDYWNSVPPTVNGMLGGFPQISRIDLQGSSNFLAKLRRARGDANTGLLPHALDCGAGIGRITFGFLLKVAQQVDIVEPVGKFTEQLKETEGFKELAEAGRIGDIKVTGLENWVSTAPYKYDLIWNQWCVGHLTDLQLVEYFKRCHEYLAEGGWIVVKENQSTSIQGEDIFDDEDSSVTRTDEKFRKLFEEAGLDIAATELQRGFPKSLYPRSYRPWYKAQSTRSQNLAIAVTPHQIPSDRIVEVDLKAAEVTSCRLIEATTNLKNTQKHLVRQNGFYISQKSEENMFIKRNSILLFS
ncbi:uncharacterized protein K452DRAFT_42328 [Aplosporella prunicola CBS 121167]|uniref:Alpha N-terminal protein methyltransferase 1 n=1 Tax=Aplosporella prunicola CBS 121167 TaxID=1176127 RepID=A0A6A6BA35_9PEZI|nr:uncharacterized protein K452DRAFT_42328 [Aplosporella prunicola CBS 121167]KAF2140886.1 hypothetical protein K452DRAFT_42328 [Aplosporella prunicola CBS 121167]